MMQNKYKNIRVLGITGGVGAGKSTVLGYLEKQYGARVILCDDVARLLQEPGEACYQAMVDLFGAEVLQLDGSFDRQRLAAKVFSDKELLGKLNHIVHPAVKQYVKAEIEKAERESASKESPQKREEKGSQSSLVVIEAALLLEDHYDLLCDEVWYVYTRDEVRRKRLKASRGYSDERISQMMENQKPDAYFREHCHFTVDNSSDQMERTFEQIDVGLRKHGLV